MGVVKRTDRTFFILDGKQDLHNGDGICFFDRQQNLSGSTVSLVEGQKIYPHKINEIYAGQKIYRNYDHLFADKLLSIPARRKIALSITIQETQNALVINAADEDGNNAQVEINDKKPALKKDAAKETFHNQLTRLGNTIFECSDFKIETQEMYFVPASQLNDARRRLVEQLLKACEINRPRQATKFSKNNVASPQKHLSFTGNALNAKAKDFYHRHGVETIEPAAESGQDLTGQVVMRTKHCLRRELNLCQHGSENKIAEPLILQDEDGKEYQVRFLCGQCGMEIFLGYEGD
jgi:putative protease